MTRAQRESARLLEMIRQAGAPVPADAVFQQTYASASMRAEGGSVWILTGPDGMPVYPLVCSQWSRRLLLRTGVTAYYLWSVGDWIIDPEDLGKISS